MRIRLRLFGYTLASITLDAGAAPEYEDEAPQGITGGPDVYLERDPYPPVPEERHNHEYEERRRPGFGFN